MKSPLSLSVQYIKGVGPKRAKMLQGIGIRTLEDLFYYFPRRYEDRTNFATISQLQQADTKTIKAKVITARERRSFRRRGFSILEIAVSDATGKIFCVWFNQPYLKEYLRPGAELILFGKVELYGSRLQMNAPEFEIVSGQDEQEALSLGRIVPVYSLPEGMTQRFMRQLVRCAIDEHIAALYDFLPYNIRSSNNLLNLAKSIVNIHFPETDELQRQAYERLSFEEFFLFQLPLALRKSRKQTSQGIAHIVDGALAREFIDGLPFRLTVAQEKAIKEIKTDLAMPYPMQRLLQGDVGSGKTVVAVIAALHALQGGYQVAFMVPTEILAKQHFENIGSQLSALGSREDKIKARLLTSGLSARDKQGRLKEIKEGKADLIIGTHALLEEEVRFKRLGLIIIDEQHKFGVGQRALLQRKSANPDVLIMTATPIPRTLAITLYGDLDISVIRELPSGRMPVQTFCFSPDKRSDAYLFCRQQLAQGNQVYVVYPVIEESYALDIAGAKKMYDKFSRETFKDFRIALIHGRLKQEEQDSVMRQFKERKLDLLVATTVLEVGIDIPTANCMMIEHAERFGLSQLHQLRGRVGRGAKKSFCLLIAETRTRESEARMKAMVKYADGFRIAEEDLRIRGPGEFFGNRQHGLSELRIGDPFIQMQLLRRARQEALKLVSVDSRLDAPGLLRLKERLLQRFPGYEALMIVG